MRGSSLNEVFAGYVQVCGAAVELFIGTVPPCRLVLSCPPTYHTMQWHVLIACVCGEWLLAIEMDKDADKTRRLSIWEARSSQQLWHACNCMFDSIAGMSASVCPTALLACLQLYVRQHCWYVCNCMSDSIAGMSATVCPTAMLTCLRLLVRHSAYVSVLLCVRHGIAVMSATVCPTLTATLARVRLSVCPTLTALLVCLRLYVWRNIAGMSMIDWLIADHLYSAILRSLEQTHCACLWFYMSDKLFITRFLNIHRSGVLKRWHGWCHMKLLPSRRKFCVHHTTMHHVTSCKATYVRCMHV